LLFVIINTSVLWFKKKKKTQLPSMLQLSNAV
jgi:hypothetical protein